MRRGRGCADGKSGNTIKQGHQGEGKLDNNHYVEALYNENRNAIPSWQGYEYQGKAALTKYLEKLNAVFESETEEEPALEECRRIKLKIEWLEDFVICRSGSISEIYQVKKTLTNQSKEEVLANFILQYKLMGRRNVQWFLVYDEQKQVQATLSESEFDNAYGTAIEQGVKQELEKLMTDRTVEFWKDNLKPNNASSQCKKTRMYLKTLFDLESKGDRKIGYETREEIDEICCKYLTVILDKCKKDKDDYLDFKEKLNIIQMPASCLEKDCKNYIQKIPLSVRCNGTLSKEDIFQKMWCKVYEKLEKVKSKKENYEFIFEDVEEVCKDADNVIYKWHNSLSMIKKRLLNGFVKPHCKKCINGPDGENCSGSGCVYSEIKDLKMDTLIDAMNLEYPNFRANTAMESVQNKISDRKLDLMMDMIEFFGTDCVTKDNEAIALKNALYFVSSILKGRTIHEKILSNYWEHTKIYRDFEYVLTEDVEYELDEENISILKKNYESDQDEISFLDTRKTKFLDYRRVKI